VSRNQLRTVLQQSFRNVDLNSWTEYKSDSEAQIRVVDMLQKEVERRSDVLDARIEKAGEEWRIQDTRLEADIAPTILAKLNTNLKTIVDEKNKKSGSSGKITGSVETEFVDASDIQWSTEGTLSVPKSIDLVNVHNSAFTDFSNMSFTETQATKGAVNEVFQGAVQHWKEAAKERQKVTVPKPKKLEVWWNRKGDDKYYVVDNPVQSNTELEPQDKENTLYASWCKPFDRSQYKQLTNEKVVAINDAIYIQPAQFGLPPIQKRWPQIMDNAVWYTYDYIEETVEDQEVDVIKDRYES
jgi:hypothetical protein